MRALGLAGLYKNFCGSGAGGGSWVKTDLRKIVDCGAGQSEVTKHFSLKRALVRYLEELEPPGLMRPAASSAAFCISLACSRSIS